ncbi:hypothetical protein Ahy_A06g029414 [Arachis hypogaea]|uniref:MULE transposase domain-containing protein n=1 Tax=Arachis hypogaea TaxID=3818 RepID=A0A445CTA2_ARAHY|nr:hypothetical protein Ahy_A06g029414 [Arachis hypogaea]
MCNAIKPVVGVNGAFVWPFVRISDTGRFGGLVDHTTVWHPPCLKTINYVVIDSIQPVSEYPGLARCDPSKLSLQTVIQKSMDGKEKSYNKVPKLLEALQSYFLGTICDLRVKLYYEGHLMVRDYCMFDKVFCVFPSCVEAFKHCKPFVSVDGTHLYGKYGGVLLIAVAQDENSNILPIAFAIVESESTKNIRILTTDLPVDPNPPTQDPALMLIPALLRKSNQPNTSKENIYSSVNDSFLCAACCAATGSRASRSCSTNSHVSVWYHLPKSRRHPPTALPGARRLRWYATSCRLIVTSPHER